MYRSIDKSKIIETTGTLKKKVHNKFPESGLSRVVDELSEVVDEASKLSVWISKPIVWLRICTYTLVIVLLMFLYLALQKLNIMLLIKNFSYEFGNFLQATESGINDVAFIGLGIFFLVTFEKRIKRKKILKALNELRSLAHVIDAHQMNKDPGHHDEEPELSDKDLSRYLDFCSDMLSLIGIIAALYVQKFDDSEALNGVDDIQDLTNGISRKIWQKISMLNRSIRRE